MTKSIRDPRFQPHEKQVQQGRKVARAFRQRTDRERPPSTNPALRLSPTAWAKLVFLRDLGETEVGGFGVVCAEDLLYMEDFHLVRQKSTVASVALDDEAVADFFDRQVDLGLSPQRFSRVWVHTHPGASPEPSVTDRETFARGFGHTAWSVMFILARGGRTYARLEFHVGPGGGMVLPVQLDFARPFPATDQDAWRAEYVSCVQKPPIVLTVGQPAWMHDADEPAFAGLPADARVPWPDVSAEGSDPFPSPFHLHPDEGNLPDDDRL